MSDITESAKISVLAIDDDPLLLELLVNYLEELGYGVIAESSGKRGMAHLSSNADVDVLVTDVHMPEMDGLELAQLMRKANPLLPIVFVSGYFTDAGSVSVSRSILINKPYSREQLACGIRQALDRSAS